MKPGHSDLEAELGDLESAEDFLEYFRIPFDPVIVQVSRLHILQRFHDYLARVALSRSPGPDDYHDCLLRAYEDFVRSDAMTEKVFRVLKRAVGISTIPVTSIGRVRR